MKRFLVLFLLLSSSAFAQWQVPLGQVPVGRGPGVIGFGSSGQTVCLTADATGVTDSTAALQACLTANTNVRIPDGTFRITDALVPQSNQLITLSAGTTIRQYTFNKNVFRSVSQTNVWIEGGRLYGLGTYCGNPSQTVTASCPSGFANTVLEDIGVYFINCTNCGARNLRTVNFATSGITFRGGNNLWAINPSIEGTHNFSTPIEEQANWQFGIVIDDSISFGVTDNVHIVGGDVGYVAQGWYIGSNAGVGSYASRAINGIGVNFHDIIGQHGVYDTSGSVSYSNITCTNVTDACIKIQVGGGGSVTQNGFSATGIVGNNVRGNFFEIAYVTVAGTLQDIQLQGVATNVGRALAINAEAGGVVRDLRAVLNATTTTGETVYLTGAGTIEADITVTAKDAALDCVLVNATNVTLRLTPILRECNTSNGAAESGIRFAAASGSVVADIINPSVTDANVRMRYGLQTNAFSTTKVIGSAVFTGAQLYGVRSDGPITQWPVWYTVSGGTSDFTGTNGLGSAITATSRVYLGSSGAIDFNADAQIRYTFNQLNFENAANGYRFDNAIVPSTNAGVSLGSATLGWNSFFLAGPTSGVITIQPQNAAGTYNFNLPTGAGSSGECLKSAGGGVAAMTWGTCLASAIGGADTQVQFNNAGSLGGSANLTWVSPALTVGAAGSTGLLKQVGATSGTVTVTPQAIAGTPTITWPNASGTVAVSATLPLVLSATTGAATCPTCVTSSGGGAITGTAPVAVSAAGAVSITGVAGQVLAGAAPAFTPTPTLGASGTLGSLTFGNATSGLLTLQPVTGALGTVTVSLPAATDTLVGKATTDTLTNKTLTSPVISTISNTGTLTLPTSTDTLVGKATTDTLTNKTFNSAGTGNTLQISGVTVSRGQLPGTATNDNATAGNIGEPITSSIPVGSALALTTSVALNVTSVSLTAGDWDVEGNVAYTGNSTTNVGGVIGGVTTTSATPPTLPDGFQTVIHDTPFTAYDFTCIAPRRRLSLSGTTTVYLVARADFSVSTMSAYGKIEARRVR